MTSYGSSVHLRTNTVIHKSRAFEGGKITVKRASVLFVLLLFCLLSILASAAEPRVVLLEDFENARVGTGTLVYGHMDQWEVVPYPEGPDNHCLRVTKTHSTIGLALEYPVEVRPGRQIVLTLKYCATGRFENRYVVGNIWFMNDKYGYGVTHNLLNPGAGGVYFVSINGAWHQHSKLSDQVITPGRDWGQWGTVKLVWEYDQLSVYVDGHLCDTITDATYADQIIDRITLWNWWRAEDDVEAVYYDDIRVEVID